MNRILRSLSSLMVFLRNTITVRRRTVVKCWQHQQQHRLQFDRLWQQASKSIKSPSPTNCPMSRVSEWHACRTWPAGDPAWHSEPSRCYTLKTFTGNSTPISCTSLCGSTFKSTCTIPFKTMTDRPIWDSYLLRTMRMLTPLGHRKVQLVESVKLCALLFSTNWENQMFRYWAAHVQCYFPAIHPTTRREGEKSQILPSYPHSPSMYYLTR